MEYLIATILGLGVPYVVDWINTLSFDSWSKLNSKLRRIVSDLANKNEMSYNAFMDKIQNKDMEAMQLLHNVEWPVRKAGKEIILQNMKDKENAFKKYKETETELNNIINDFSDSLSGSSNNARDVRKEVAERVKKLDPTLDVDEFIPKTPKSYQAREEMLNKDLNNNSKITNILGGQNNEK